MMSAGRLYLLTLFAPSVSVEGPIIVQPNEWVIIQVLAYIDNHYRFDNGFSVRHNGLTLGLHSFLIVGYGVDCVPRLA